MALKQYVLTFTDDREPIQVAPTFADSVAFEAYLRANPRLGKIQDNIILSTGYRCWAAARRAGLTAERWAEFSEAIADVEMLDDSEPLDDDEYAVDTAGHIAGKSTPQEA